MRTVERYKSGYIEKRGSVWYLQYRDGETRKRERIGTTKDFPTKGAAERAAAGIRERINDPHAAVAPKTMADVAARYIAEEMPERHSTSKNYRYYLNNFILPAYGARPIAGIKAHEVRSWLRALTVEHDGQRVPMADKTRGHIHGVLRIMFRFAMLWEWYAAGENPMRLFRLERSSRRRKKPRILTPEEYRALLAELGEPYRTMALVCGALGLRCSELVALQWGDIDWLRKTIAARRAAVGRYIDDVKTANSDRPLPLSDELLEVLSHRFASAGSPDPQEWIFPSSQHGGRKPYNAYAIQRYRITPAAVRAGLGSDVGWHTLRHSYRAWLDRAGAPVGVQRDLMRHADIRTTMNVYGDSFIETLRGAQSDVAKMLVQ